MSEFMESDFLLKNKTAKDLYFSYAVNMPIIDYHCHLSAKEIWENKMPENISQIWFRDDHYKWRLMRANGISEKYITGSGTDYEKFAAYAATLPYAVGNPLFHWTHLELQKYFGIRTVLGPETCKEIWKQTQKIMEERDFSPQKLIKTSGVYALCTTEDPVDTLEYHKKIRKSNYSVKILPAMRPDALLAIEKETWKEYIFELEKISRIEIKSFSNLQKAMIKRMDFFEENGCIAADHGFAQFPWKVSDETKVEKIFSKALSGIDISLGEIQEYKTALLIWLGKEYHRRNWAMEIHTGAIRSCNSRMVEQLGEAKGYDTVGDYKLAEALGAFMNELEKTDELPKMILFSLNNKDNLVLAVMAGTFQNEELPSKIQMGTAWWFMDHKDGMEDQMKILANEGLLGRFIGMLTDSRSFLSYSRHDYFRRILCNLLGKWVEDGEFPNNRNNLKMLVEGICFYNAKNYFNL